MDMDFLWPRLSPLTVPSRKLPMSDGRQLLMHLRLGFLYRLLADIMSDICVYYQFYALS